MKNYIHKAYPLLEDELTFTPLDLQKALYNLIGEAAPDLDLLQKAGGVVKGTHKKDNPDYEPIRKNGKVVGYKKKGQAEPASEAGTLEERTGVAHPIGTRVAIKSRDGRVIQGVVHKHGQDHKDMGKLIHIKTDDGKEYTRYSHNTHQTTGPAQPKDTPKDVDPDAKPAKADTSHLHPIGARVTVKTRKGERVPGEVVKHGDDHGEKGHLIHVKTDHGMYVRYNHNTSRVETGEKTKVEVPAVAKPEPVKPVEKLKSNAQVVRDKREADDKKLWKEAEKGLTDEKSEGVQREFRDLAGLDFAESQKKKQDLEGYITRTTNVINGNGDVDPSKKDDNSIYRTTILNVRRKLAELSRLEAERIATDPNYKAMTAALAAQTPAQKATHAEMDSHSNVIKSNALDLNRQVENYKNQGFDKMRPKEYNALVERNRVAKVREKRYRNMMDQFLLTGDLTKALGDLPIGSQDSITVRKRGFTNGDVSVRGAVDPMMTTYAKDMIPDQFFTNLPSIADSYTHSDDSGPGSHNAGGKILINRRCWGALTPSVELHEYAHYMHGALGILKFNGSSNCPIAKHIMIDELGKEWEAKPIDEKRKYTKSRIESGLLPDELKSAGDAFKRCNVTDVIGAISATKTSDMYGQGHRVEYYLQGRGQRNAVGNPVTTPHHYQMNEIFCHFADSYFTGNESLRQVFPKTHALAMAYFAKIIVNGKDKQ